MALPLSDPRLLGASGVSVPPIVFGTSALGNLYQELAYDTKLDIARTWFETVSPPVAVDSAGKYGAGLALEMIGRTLRELGVDSRDVVISNKLGWKRVPLSGPEPTFERGVWKGIGYDAVQDISYDGILACFEQGTELLGSPYSPSLISVHDPDEYLAVDTGRERRFRDVLGAYRALDELKKQGAASAVGVGAKDWHVIEELSRHTHLDWVMFACSMTLYTHPPQLVSFMESLADSGIGIINSAVFNAGFLIGGAYFDYREVNPASDRELFQWRETFLSVCRSHGVNPADACVEFGLSAPGVASVALNTSKPRNVEANVRAVVSEAPAAFWRELRDKGIVRKDYDYI